MKTIGPTSRAGGMRIPKTFLPTTESASRRAHSSPRRKQVYVSGDIDDGSVWELVRRAPKTVASDARRAVRSKGPRIVVEK